MGKYKYFVSFNHVNADGTFGFTNAIIDVNKTITDINVVESIQNKYQETLKSKGVNAKYVAIISYQIIEA